MIADKNVFHHASRKSYMEIKNVKKYFQDSDFEKSFQILEDEKLKNISVLEKINSKNEKLKNISGYHICI